MEFPKVSLLEWLFILVLEPNAGSGGESDSSSILSTLAAAPVRQGLDGGAAGGVGNKGRRFDLTMGPSLGVLDTFNCSICFLR